MTERAYLLVNFGGPRNLEEIRSFLTALLQDRDVIWTRLPSFFHNLLFGWIAWKRAKKIRVDYEQIGGKSPIYFDTESIAESLRSSLKAPVVTFHRYLTETHEDSLRKLESLDAPTIHVLPLFPQFCYATTGSIARFLKQNLSRETKNKLRWISSYSADPAYIASFRKKIGSFLESQNLQENDTALLFSAHGVPRCFPCQGDPYKSECERSFELISSHFPQAISHLSYQSKFGPDEWIRPYTDETCGNISSWSERRPNIVIVPLTFTSDHIETLYEIEKLYLPLLREQKVRAFRCPALNLEPDWLQSLAQIAQSHPNATTEMLIRDSSTPLCCK